MNRFMKRIRRKACTAARACKAPSRAALVGVLVSSQAFAGFPPPTAKGAADAGKAVTFNLQAPNSQITRVDAVTGLIETGNQNVIINPNAAGGTAGYTASGGTFTTTGSGASTAFSWDSGSAGQTVASGYQTVATSDPWSGRNGAVSIAAKCAASSTCTHVLRVYDGTNPIASGSIVTTNETNPKYQVTSVNFLYPESGTVRWELLSVASNEPAIVYRGVYMGLADGLNLQQVGQASFYGGARWVKTASCAWAGSGGSPSNYSADPDCTNPSGANLTGAASAPATKVPGVLFSTLAPGEYLVLAKGNMQVSAVSTTCHWTLSDGTSTDGFASAARTAGGDDPRANTLIGRFSYSTAQSNTTFQIQYKVESGAGNCEIDAAANDNKLEFLVYRFPTSTEQVYRPDVQNWRVDANISGANISLGTSDQASYVTPNNGSLTLTQNAGSITTWISCSSTNDATGTTCSSGSEEPGISFTVPRAGTVRACASFGHRIGLTASSGDEVEASFQLVETANTSQTIVQEGKARVPSGLRGVNSGATGPYAEHGLRVCGEFIFASAGRKTIRLMYEQDVAGTPPTNYILADAAAASGQWDVHWTVEPIDQAVPAPLLVGSVTSNSSGLERIERARFDQSGSSAPTVNSQSGNWIGTPARNNNGDYTIPINAGIFSGTPVCMCNNYAPATSEARACHIQNGTAPSATGVRVALSTAGTLTDSAFDLICMGPR